MTLTSVSEANALVDALIRVPIVEVAYVEAPPAPPTKNFTSQQGYLNPAPIGIDSHFVHAIDGGDASGVKIIDIEYDWNQSHADLSKAINALIPNKTPQVPDFPDVDDDVLYVRNHGTAVLGVLVADRNEIGVTGTAFSANLRLVNVYNAEDQYDLADSIAIAHDNLGGRTSGSTKALPV